MRTYQTVVAWFSVLSLGVDVFSQGGAATFELTIVPLGAVKSEWFAKAVKVRPNVSATTTHPGKYDAKFAIDRNPNTEWAQKGPTGQIHFKLPSSTPCSLIVIEARRWAGTDLIQEGMLTINGQYSIPFQNFKDTMAMIIKVPKQILISSVTIESRSGRSNPGISELYFVP